MSEDILVTFVIPKHCNDQNDCSEDMLIAYEACGNHQGGGLKARWIHENSLNIDSLAAKKHIFVISQFEGELYEKLKSTNCLLVGPRCLSCCFTEGNSIPSRRHPVYTVAMRSLMVTASGLSRDFKAKIKQKIEWMGGTYSSVLTDATTHLISNNVFSDKYIKAAERGIPVMQETWVDAVWEASLKLDISGSSSDFDCYRLPPFANLQITTSGLSLNDKKLIIKLINTNGGEFSRVFQSETTDVLVLTKTRKIRSLLLIHAFTGCDTVSFFSGKGKKTAFEAWASYPQATDGLKYTIQGHIEQALSIIERFVIVMYDKDNIGSEKCKAAIEYGKVCVTPNWIKDSAALGFALPVARYKICTASTSSPIADSRLPDMSLNFSRITKDGRTGNFVNETRTTDVDVLSENTKLYEESRKDASVSDEIQRAFECFDLSSIKKAGPIFDGFCIWVTGLDGLSRERASACVSRGGGVRYDGPHERVTHVVAGADAAAAAAAAALPAVPVLSPLWLIRSVEAGRVVDEMEFVVNAQQSTPVKTSQLVRTAPSPMSKRNLQLLMPAPLALASATAPTAPAAAPTPHAPPDQFSQPDHIVNHYLSQNLPEADVTKSLDPVLEVKSTNNEDLTVITRSEYIVADNIFKDIVFEVQGLEEEAICEIGSEISEAGGVLAAAGAGGSRVLVPLDFDTNNLITKDAEAVTVFWVKDCLSQQALIPIEYYHRPVKLRVTGVAPLRGVVTSLSTYTGVERAFLNELAKLLGATIQQRFCRRDTANALASTHLICPVASGAKYAGALRWAVPAVRASWLLECAATGSRVSESKHSVNNHVTETGPSPPKVAVDAVQQSKDTSDAKLVTTETTTPNVDCSVSKAAEELMLPPGADATGSPSTLVRRTRINKKQNKKAMFEGMSPATRFITMWRMGMFNSDHEDSSKENSPKQDCPEEESAGNLTSDSNQEVEPERECTMQTPPLDEVFSTSNLRGLSPTTRRRLQAVKRGEMSSDPVRTPINPFQKRQNTPNSKIGGDLRPGCKRMSLDARKRLWGFVSDLPSDYVQPNNENTPISDLCGTFLAQFDKKTAAPFDQTVARKMDLQDTANSPPPKRTKLKEDQCAGGTVLEASAARDESSASSALDAEVDVQLQRLSSVLTGRRTPRAARARSSGATHADMNCDSEPESQPNTVGWDDTTPSQKHLGSREQVAKLKRVKTAPTEMIRSHLDQEVSSDCKQIIPSTVPSHDNDKNYVANKLIYKAGLKIKVNEKHSPEYARARNLTVDGRTGSSSENQNDEGFAAKDNELVNDNLPNKNIVQNQRVVELTKTDVHYRQNNSESHSKPSSLIKRFMLSSNVDNREETVKMIVRLGGAVTDLEEDAAAPASHLLCAAPARSQRILNSIAAGCWVLHPAYVARSATAGAFLPEEAFEWGNPAAECLPSVSGSERALALAAHRWRTRRARSQPGPFAGVIALLHVPVARNRLLTRFILAGDGVVVDQQPPYTDESITVCFADPKRYPMKSRDKKWLLSRGIPVCAPILLSSFLTEETTPDLREHCLPAFIVQEN